MNTSVARHNLYSTDEHYTHLLNVLDGEVDPETGEISVNFDSILNAVYELEGELPEKAAQAACVYLEACSEIDRIDAAIKRLKEMQDQKKKGADLLKVSIDGFCKKYNIEKVDGALVKISYRKSSRVEIDNEADIPEEYWRIKKEPDKTAIKAALKAGKEIGGAHIEESSNIQIK